MATIALYAGKANLMPGLKEDVRKSVTDFKSGLLELRREMLKIDKNIFLKVPGISGLTGEKIT